MTEFPFNLTPPASLPLFLFLFLILSIYISIFYTLPPPLCLSSVFSFSVISLFLTLYALLRLASLFCQIDVKCVFAVV